ncbi:hypothetical protein JVX93_21575 [Mycolicibacterium boenickei]|nr:hypothetical protein JVX93_21575 [Mycolicibacterium boenickei]
MIHRTMHWRTARRILAASAAVLVVAGTGIAAATEAHADRIDRVICAVLDDYPTPDGVQGVAQGLIENGYTPYAAGQKIAEAVTGTCPEHLPEVLLFARAASGGSVLA